MKRKAKIKACYFPLTTMILKRGEGGGGGGGVEYNINNLYKFFE